jgi:hypothetical protein
MAELVIVDFGGVVGLQLVVVAVNAVDEAAGIVEVSHHLDLASPAGSFVADGRHFSNPRSESFTRSG